MTLISAFPTYLLHRFIPELLMPVPVFHLLAISGGLAMGVIANRIGADLRNLFGGITMAGNAGGRAIAAETV
ncbi:hypothetical protein [Rhizobium sp. NZLR3b]|uniref:hypothetical protein n=1 Tax=Rhizobium sp. NZLR3b TaxID=2731101 RepID=UPI0021809DFE|nr:hypothetical protein [Rhizobium sp. NZLR3b]